MVLGITPNTKFVYSLIYEFSYIYVNHEPNVIETTFPFFTFNLTDRPFNLLQHLNALVFEIR